MSRVIIWGVRIVIVYSVGLIIMSIITFATYWSYEKDWGPVANYFYNFLSRKFYVIGLFMFCLPLMFGNLYYLGGWLGANFFLPLAKLSFSTYIIHPIFIKHVFFNFRSAYYFTQFNFFLWGSAFVVVSYVSSILVATLFEMPFQNIRALLQSKYKKKLPPKGEPLLSEKPRNKNEDLEKPPQNFNYNAPDIKEEAKVNEVEKY